MRPMAAPLHVQIGNWHCTATPHTSGGPCWPPLVLSTLLPCSLRYASVIMHRAASNAGETKCAAAVASWLDMQAPAEIEDAISAFVPADQPLRDEVLNTLVKVGRPPFRVAYRGDCSHLLYPSGPPH